MINWIVTDIDPENQNLPKDLSEVWKCRIFTIYSEKNNICIFEEDSMPILIILDGYVMPRKKDWGNYSNHCGEELIYQLFIKYGKDVTSHIKGNYTIVIAQEDSILAFNDHLAIKKFFYSNHKNKTLLSNNFEFICRIAGSFLNPENLAIHSLYNHFIGGATLAKNINFTDRAYLFILDVNKPMAKFMYWDLQELLHLEPSGAGYRDFTSFFSGLLFDYVNYTESKNISLSLTGGLDSRLILSAMLSLDIIPSTYTFGNPDSGDVKTASQVSEIFGLDFKNHFYSNPGVSWFKRISEEILKEGNSLTHFHRAFRWQGIRDEHDYRPGSDLVLGGFMGGEGIKGVFDP